MADYDQAVTGCTEKNRRAWTA